MLHRFYDGSILRKISAKELIKIDIWKGNRIMDIEHANKIRDAIGGLIELLDSGYRIVKYNESAADGSVIQQSYIIDGQHRLHVLREHFQNNMCEPDFDVIITEKNVHSESEAIEFFNTINNVKPQRWKTDPAILVNQYIAEFEKQFNKENRLIRASGARRPYLSVDRLREVLKENVKRLEQETSKIQGFVKRAVEENRKLLLQAPMLILANTKISKYYERALEVKFALAVDEKLKWINSL